MYANPQDALPLPPKPSLEQYKKRAKDLVHASESGAPGAIRAWAARWLDALIRAHGVTPTPERQREIDRRVDLIAAFIEKRLATPGRPRATCTVTDAQFIIARAHGFESWPKFTAYLESTTDTVQGLDALTAAINANDLARVIALMTREPTLHGAPLGYGKDGPLTWVAECGTERLEMAAWMLQNGSDVHQGGDGPLMRAALADERIPMMELLVRYGADVNAVWHDEFPIIFAPCETVQPAALTWLLNHGANPNCDAPGREYAGTALDSVIGSYARSPQLSACIDALVAAGAVTKYREPAVLDLLRGRLDLVAGHLAADPTLLHTRFPGLDFGTTGGRMLTLRGSTLLHVAAEYRNLEAITMLLDRGADVNAMATVDASGMGGQTALFHAVTQREDAGLTIAELLLRRGADASLRATVPGHYERPGEVIECTALGYASRFEHEPGRNDKVKTVAWLRTQGAPE